ncbi:MAG: M48 family metalloprotease [Bdellovibrionales bacterium]|nr:M48 family metalloprotease [Bdellovibrionales bacterium]
MILTINVLLSLEPVWAHTEGMIVDHSRPKFLACQCEASNYPLANTYILEVFNKLYAANKEAFKPIANGPENYCVGLAKQFGINAYAIVQTGKIVITGNLLANFSSEEAIAAIIAHEMAHIAMYHADPIPFELRATSSPRVVELLRQIVQKNEELNNARLNRDAFYSLIASQVKQTIVSDLKQQNRGESMLVLNKYQSYQKISMTSANIYSHPLISDDVIYGELIDIGKAYGIELKLVEQWHELAMTKLSEIQQLENSVNQLLGGKYHHSMLTNFREREADEVGFEFYVRAGYDPAQYENGILTIIAAKNSDLNSIDEAKKYCEEQIRTGSIQQGDDTHPKPCWRVQNMRTELQRHHEYYLQLHSQALKKNISTPYGKVQEELSPLLSK